MIFGLHPHGLSAGCDGALKLIPFKACLEEVDEMILQTHKD